MTARVAAIHGIVEQKRPVDPAIAAVAILDPDQDVFHAVEKLGQLQQIPVLSHDKAGRSGIPARL